MSTSNKIRKLLFKAQSALGHTNAVEQAVKKSSVKPLAKRAANWFVGKKIVRKMWWR